MILLINYAVALVSSIVVGAILGMKISFDMDSFEGSVLFPTPFVALGLTALIGYLITLDLISSVIIGIFASVFSKFANKIFPGVTDVN
ncbi:membrane-bound hydrogenase subunit ehaA [Methanococcus maripaludis C5]|uniref:Probable [NiFe]-hydrogenase-type-3 Eha complex membrane subunit A n=1 Tax=Methanococcus maripaludis (strain C5 / ATCC BAA-1333) TaxID=402880 RepID=A4FW76_METM5|nr:energy-converting NiFe hydrogenase A subunit EhaA [Methanococcus maripaludis]ABO34447.1 membrane-bound hydrogenase subunit ehaA [Methanococcus maripaludis C5]